MSKEDINKSIASADSTISQQPKYSVEPHNGEFYVTFLNCFSIVS